VQQGSGMLWGAGVQFRVLDPLFLELQLFGDVIPSGQLDERGAASTLATAEALAGARYQLTREISLGLAAGTGLASAIGDTDVSGVLTIAYAAAAPILPSLYHPEAPPPPPDPTKEDTDFD